MKILYSKNLDSDLTKKDYLKNDFYFLDMTIHQFLLISKLMKYLKKNNINCIWKNKWNSKYFTVENTIIVLIENLSNTLWVIRFLLSKGSDHQAKILFRNFIEQLDIIIAILGNFDFFDKYTHMYNDKDIFLDASKKWFEHIRPKKFTPFINRVYNEVIKNKNLGKIMSNLKKSNYQWLSLFAHAHFDTLQISSIIIDENENTRFNSYCSPDLKISFTLNKLLLHSSMGNQIIFELIKNTHSIEKFLNEELIEEMNTNYNIYKDIYFKNVEYLLAMEQR